MVWAAAEAVRANASHAAIVVNTCALLPTSMHTQLFTEEMAAHAPAARAVNMPSKNQLTVSASHTGAEQAVARPRTPHSGNKAPGVGSCVANLEHPPATLISRMVKEIRKFSGAPLDDDLTVLALATLPVPT